MRRGGVRSGCCAWKHCPLNTHSLPSVVGCGESANLLWTCVFPSLLPGCGSGVFTVRGLRGGAESSARWGWRFSLRRHPNLGPSFYGLRGPSTCPGLGSSQSPTGTSREPCWMPMGGRGRFSALRERSGIPRVAHWLGEMPRSSVTPSKSFLLPSALGIDVRCVHRKVWEAWVCGVPVNRCYSPRSSICQAGACQNARCPFLLSKEALTDADRYFTFHA